MSSNGVTAGVGTSEKKSLIQILGESGKITREQAREAMQQKSASRDAIETILIDMGVSETDVYQAHAAMMGVSFLDLSKIKPDPKAGNLLPGDMQERYKAVPIRLDGKTLTVAMANPKDLFAIDEMGVRTNLQIRAVFSPPGQVTRLKQALENGGATNEIDELSPEAEDSGNYNEAIPGFSGSVGRSPRLY